MKKLGAIIITLSLIVSRFFASNYYFQMHLSDNQYFISSNTITGYIQEILHYSPAETKFFLSSDDWQGNLFVSARNLPPLLVGQKVTIQAAKVILWPNLEAGSFKNYLLLKNVWAQVEKGQIKVFAEFKKDWNYYIFQIHSFFNMYLLRKFSSDVAGFLAGVLFGDTDLLSAEVKNAFRLTGLSHVMAISGANMTMIAQILFQLLFFVSLKKRIIITITMLVLFTIFVGASAAVLRALVMAIIVLISLWFNLPYLASRALLVVCFFVYFWNPHIMLYDVGFQLSVAATYGLLVAVKPLSTLFCWIPWKLLKETLAITLSATIFTMPIALYYFGSISILSPIINILLVPILASMSIFGYLVVVISMVPFIGESVTLVAEYTLKFLLLLVNYFSTLAQLVVLEVSFPLWLVLLWFGILIGIFRFLNKRFV